MKLEFDLKENTGKNVLIAEKLSVGYSRKPPTAGR
jgi:hypothetical protein